MDVTSGYQDSLLPKNSQCTRKFPASKLFYGNTVQNWLMIQVAPSLLHFVFSAYSNYSSRWLSHTSYTAFDLTLSDLALKIARRLICYGFVSPHDNDDSRQFFALLSSQVETMWRIFSNAESNAQAGHAESSYDMETLVAKHLLHAGKFCMGDNLWKIDKIN